MVERLLWWKSQDGLVVQAQTLENAERWLREYLGDQGLIDARPCGCPGFGSPYIAYVPGEGVLRQTMHLMGNYGQPHRMPFWWVGPCRVDDDGTGLAYLPVLCSDGTVIQCRDRKAAETAVIRLRVLEALAFAGKMARLGFRINVPEIEADTLLASQAFAVAVAVQVPDHGVDAWLEQCDREKAAHRPRPEPSAPGA